MTSTVELGTEHCVPALVLVPNLGRQLKLKTVVAVTIVTVWCLLLLAPLPGSGWVSSMGVIISAFELPRNSEQESFDDGILQKNQLLGHGTGRLRAKNNKQNISNKSAERRLRDSVALLPLSATWPRAAAAARQTDGHLQAATRTR